MRALEIAILSEDTVFNEITIKILKKTIEPVSFRVYTSLSELKEIKQGEKFDTVIINETIPGTGRGEVVRFLRANKKIVSPIYYFSNSGKDTKKRVLLNGANFIFEKPFNPDEFIEHFKQTLKI